MKHYGDITKLSGYDLPVVDCICGGSPCQNLSVAGNQKGLEGSESRLFLEQARIVKEMLNNGRSNGSSGLRFMVWENVPGAMQTNGGRDFQRVLSEIVQICEPNAPAVPMPKSGKWTKSGCLYDDMGGGGQLLGEYTTQSFGESARDGVESHLSQILEDSPPRKYYLSAAACAGIIRRSAKKGKTLPPALLTALKNQAGMI